MWKESHKRGSRILAFGDVWAILFWVLVILGSEIMSAAPAVLLARTRS
jgi:hypothetical protein